MDINTERRWPVWRCDLFVLLQKIFVRLQKMYVHFPKMHLFSVAAGEPRSPSSGSLPSSGSGPPAAEPRSLSSGSIPSSGSGAQEPDLRLLPELRLRALLLLQKILVLLHTNKLKFRVLEKYIERQHGKVARRHVVKKN